MAGGEKPLASPDSSGDVFHDLRLEARLDAAGYGAMTLPGVGEAIEERRFAGATTYIGRTAEALDA